MDQNLQAAAGWNLSETKNTRYSGCRKTDIGVMFRLAFDREIEWSSTENVCSERWGVRFKVERVKAVGVWRGPENPGFCSRRIGKKKLNLIIL